AWVRRAASGGEPSASSPTTEAGACASGSGTSARAGTAEVSSQAVVTHAVHPRARRSITAPMVSQRGSSVDAPSDGRENRDVWAARGPERYAARTLSTAIALPHPPPALPLDQVPTPCYVVDRSLLQA